LRDLESADDQNVEQDVTATKDLLGLASVVVETYTQHLKSAPLDIVTRKKRGWNYAELATANLQQRTGYEDRAIAFLERAVTLAKLSSNGIDEVELIRGEKAFRRSLRMRPEFRNLLGKIYEQ
jgi:hypothetical protein